MTKGGIWASVSVLLAVTLLASEAGATTGCSGGAPWRRKAAVDPVARALLERARRFFQWLTVIERPAVEVCEYRVRLGETAWAIARRLEIPLWVVERLNPGTDLSRLHPRSPLRLPAAARGVSRACFTPIRPWRARPESGPPFFW